MKKEYHGFKAIKGFRGQGTIITFNINNKKLSNYYNRLRIK